jgi:hypothetical protein
VDELAAVRGILECFGEASGLRVNFLKSSVAPIQCSQDIADQCSQALDCPIQNLPCTYLGLPLSIKKLRKEDLQSILDKLARKLAFWKAKLLTKDGRVAFVQAVMTASVVSISLDGAGHRALVFQSRGSIEERLSVRREA